MSDKNCPDDKALDQLDKDAKNASLRRQTYAYGKLPSDLDYLGYFYQAETYPDLVKAMLHHIEKLQSKQLLTPEQIRTQVRKS